MTNIFNKIPNDFFKILTSKNKELFLESLFHIDDLLQGNIYFSRDKVVDSLQNHFSSLGITFKELEYDDEYEEEIKSVRTLVQSVLRQLEKKGWLRVNLEEGFTQQVSFPSYVNSFIQVLREIDSDQSASYSSYVFSTYSALKTGLEDPSNLLEGLESAWTSTKGLHRAIQNTYFDLSEMYAKIVDDLTTSEMLSQHFDIYKQEIIDQVLFPLKTRDSLPRFKNTILNLLTKYNSDEVIELLITQNLKNQNQLISGFELEAERQVLMYLNGLADFYRDVSFLIDKIDNKKNEYTEKSIGKIQYRLRSDFQLKDKIDQLIHQIKEDNENQTYDLANITEFQIVDQESLYEPRKKKEDISKKARKKIELSRTDEDTFGQEQYQLFKKLANPKYSSKNIDQFILELLKGKEEISTLEYKITTYEVFILTIMGAIRGYEENESGYIVIIENKYVRNGYYKIPK
ncbi:Wadjet anti-phage system protein JetA family protein [Candidatus Enterococcus mansonii]